MSDAWNNLAPAEKEAANDAMQTLSHASLRFVLVVFSDAGVGGVLSNIEPSEALKPLEAALRAAQSGVEVSEVVVDRLQ